MRVALASSLAAGLLACGGLAGVGVALYDASSSRQVYAKIIQTGSGPLMPTEIALDPSMNPIRITVSARVNQGNRAAVPQGREQYQVSLYMKLRLEKRWLALLSADDADGKPRAEASFAITPVEVAEAGTYTVLLLRPEGDITPLFSGHDVRLWRNATTIDTARIWLAAILLLLGLLLQLFAGLPLRRK